MAVQLLRSTAKEDGLLFIVTMTLALAGLALLGLGLRWLSGPRPEPKDHPPGFGGGVG